MKDNDNFVFVNMNEYVVMNREDVNELLALMIKWENEMAVTGLNVNRFFEVQRLIAQIGLMFDSALEGV